MVLFFIIFFVLYTALNYYVFIRGWQALSTLPFFKPFYIPIYIIIAYGYVFAKVLHNFLPPIAYDVWLGIGAFWFAFLVYFTLILFGIDIIRLLDSFFHFFPDSMINKEEIVKKITAVIVIAIVSLIVFLGNLNKRDITITSLDITLPKGDAKLSELNIVFASDLHLSTIDGEKLLGRIVEKINSVSPDLILLAGDVVDDKAVVLRNRGIGESFKLLKPRLGIYTINGNHEFINNVEPSVKFLNEYGMKVLRDNYELVDSSVYIVGREDVSMKQFTGRGRKSLEQIVQPLENNYPTILLDHTPVKLEQAVKNRIDMQLSGHTHHGQIWPANIITGIIYELSWGYKKKGGSQFYVTSGAGTWGPPVRTGSKSDIVDIKRKFSDGVDI